MGQSFMMKRSQSFASHRIHQATFSIRRFTNRGSEDSLVDSIIARLRRPVSVRGSPDAHEAPGLVSPVQNRTMRRKKTLSISVKIAQ
jgi:hypothetical protein